MSSLLERVFSLTGKSALVTGASGGIGRELAVALAEAGAAIGVHGTNAEKIAATCQRIEGHGGRAVPLAAELRTVAACRQLVANAHAQLGRLDILVMATPAGTTPLMAASGVNWVAAFASTIPRNCISFSMHRWSAARICRS